MNQILPASYSPSLVLLSYLISAVGAFAALSAAAQMNTGTVRARRLNLLAASVALGGIGVWAMHFVGMLSLRVRMAVSYSPFETAASLLAAVAACAVALRMLSQHRSVARLLAGGLLLGAAVCVMHYLGMYGMRFPGHFVWDAAMVAASIGIAVAAATAGLWLAFSVQGLRARVVAALVIGLAVCAMHYTGMAAADFVCTSADPFTVPEGLGLISSWDLPILVTSVSLGLAVVIVVDQAFQRFDGGARRAGSAGIARPIAR
jgi:NO-binding membrane sensor protein with MHYT domain